MFKIPISYHLRKLTNDFVNYDIIQQSEEQYRARILAGCLLVMTTNAALISLYLFFAYLYEALDPTGLIISATISCFYILCLFLLKRTGKTLLIAHAFVTPLYLSILAVSFIAGGPSASSNQIMLLVPITVFFTAGNRSGFVWSAIVLITQMGLLLMHLQGFEFTQVMDQETQIEQGFFHWLITFSGIIGIARVYEKAHQNLVRQRNMRENDNRFLANHDQLTGSANRLAMERMLANQIKSSQKHKLTFTVVLIDIRQFHQINARYGYTVGNNILVTLASRLNSISDIKQVARTNGKQFTLITHAHNKDFNREAFIGNLLHLSSQPFSIGHQIISINPCIGFADFSNSMMTSDELMLKAEQSLANAREQNLAYLPG